VELAAIGSQPASSVWPVRCRRIRRVPRTGLAEVRKNDAVFRQVMPPGRTASPFDFINAANNMAAFYSPNSEICAHAILPLPGRAFFEWALHLAAADLRAGAYRQVLVGGVDENSSTRQPPAAHRFARRQPMVKAAAGYTCLLPRARVW